MAIVPEISSGDSHTADHINQPFHVRSAVYDSTNDEIDITVGEGRADWGNDSVTEFTSAQTTSVSSPSTGTTYFVYIQSDGTLHTTTSSTYDGSADDSVRLGSVTTGSTVDDLTRDDLRGILPRTGFVEKAGDSMSGDLSLESGVKLVVPDESGTNYQFGDTSAITEDSTGMMVEPSTNPASGGPLFIVNSSGAAQRLRVEHDGAVRTDNADMFVGASNGSGGNQLAKIETGSYTGDGASTRTISTSFTPKQVTISASEVANNNEGAVGWLTDQSFNYAMEGDGALTGSSDFVIVSGGFQVAGASFMNADTVAYSYVALG